MGNKLKSLRRRIIIDLEKRSKIEIIRAVVDKVRFGNLNGNEYEEEADEWLEKYLPNFTTITVQGKGGKIATLPYTEKEKMLDKIISIFNS